MAAPVVSARIGGVFIFLFCPFLFFLEGLSTYLLPPLAFVLPLFASQFCARYDPNFTEDMLDMHYWKECPMLTSCKFCGQVVEIMTLNVHMLEECEKRSKFGKGFLTDLDANMDKCPLCQVVVAPLTETGWKEHVLKAKGCDKNPRTAHLRKQFAPAK
jgi:hypothetical protein